jgi:hypothetical protein
VVAVQTLVELAPVIAGVLDIAAAGIGVAAVFTAWRRGE